MIDGHFVSTINTVEEYRIDVTGKSLALLNALCGSLFICPRNLNGTASQPNIVDIYGVYLELSHKGGFNPSALISS